MSISMSRNRNILNQIKLFDQYLELCHMNVIRIVYPGIEITNNNMFTWSEQQFTQQITKLLTEIRWKYPNRYVDSCHMQIIGSEGERYGLMLDIWIVSSLHTFCLVGVIEYQCNTTTTSWSWGVNNRITWLYNLAKTDCRVFIAPCLS